MWVSAVPGGTLSNSDIYCSIDDDERKAITTDSDVFWLVNGMLYGLLQVPLDFKVCCSLKSLRIPVALQEMDGYRFQCAHIDYQTNTVYLGEVTVLDITSPSAGMMGIYKIIMIFMLSITPLDSSL